MRLKANLRQILAKKDISASELARNAKVPKTTISDWLAGASPKNLRQLKSVADFLKLSVDELVFSTTPGSERREPKSVIEEFTQNEIYAGKYEVTLRKIIK